MKIDILLEKSYSSINLLLRQQRSCISNTKVKKTLNVGCIIQTGSQEREDKDRRKDQFSSKYVLLLYSISTS